MSLSLALALSGAAGGAVGDPAIGRWANPKGSLEVRTQRCGEQLCATVVAASPHAQQKAQAAGVPALIGTQIFSNYRARGDGEWAGTLYLPDRNRRVSSTLETNHGRSVKISGCLIGRFICKTQVWTRVDRVAQR